MQKLRINPEPHDRRSSECTFHSDVSLKVVCLLWKLTPGEAKQRGQAYRGGGGVGGWSCVVSAEEVWNTGSIQRALIPSIASLFNFSSSVTVVMCHFATLPLWWHFSLCKIKTGLQLALINVTSYVDGSAKVTIDMWESCSFFACLTGQKGCLHSSSRSKTTVASYTDCWRSCFKSTEIPFLSISTISLQLSDLMAVNFSEIQWLMNV